MTGDTFPLQALLPIFVYFAIGLFFRRRGIVTGEHAAFLFRLVFLVTLPALVFQSVSKANLDAETALLPVIGFLVNFACLATAVIVGRLRAYPPPVAGAIAVSAGVINMSYTFPFVLATLGQEALADAILFDVGNAVFAAFCGYPVAEYFGQHKAGLSAATVKRVLLAPIFIAVALAILVNLSGIVAAPPFDAVLAPLGAATIPLMLISVGMSFGGLTAHVTEAVITIAIRMLFGGLAGLALVQVLGLDGLVAAIVVVSAAAPVGASAAAVTAVTGLNRDVAVNAVSISALIGLFTTSALLFLTSRVFA